MGILCGMLSRTDLVEIVSGKRRGVLATAIRFCLGCLTPAYRLAIGIRNRQYDRAMARQDETIIKHAGIPVISVGNLTTGGTGKTPLVISLWLSEPFRLRVFPSTDASQSCNSSIMIPCWLRVRESVL